MKHTADVRLEMESDSTIAQVICTRCQQSIGRVQTENEPEENPIDFDREVEGELSVIASEHRQLCPQRPK